MCVFAPSVCDKVPWCVGVQLRYLGFSAKNDEWVPKASPRIQPYNSRAHESRGPTAETVLSDQELIFDDADDPEDAVLCQRKRYHISTHFLSTVNLVLFERRGMEMFLDRLVDREKPLPVAVRVQLFTH